MQGKEQKKMKRNKALCSQGQKFKREGKRSRRNEKTLHKVKQLQKRPTNVNEVKVIKEL
jgi:hypothetical protein